MKSMNNNAVTFSRAIRLPRVCELTGTSPATVWRMTKCNSSFPKPFKLSDGVTCWDEEEVRDWVKSKMTERGAA